MLHSALSTQHSALSTQHIIIPTGSVDWSKYPKLHSRLITLALGQVLAEMERKAKLREMIDGLMSRGNSAKFAEEIVRDNLKEAALEARSSLVNILRDK